MCVYLLIYVLVLLFYIIGAFRADSPHPHPREGHVARETVRQTVVDQFPEFALGGQNGGHAGDGFLADYFQLQTLEVEVEYDEYNVCICVCI